MDDFDDDLALWAHVTKTVQPFKKPETVVSGQKDNKAARHKTVVAEGAGICGQDDWSLHKAGRGNRVPVPAPGPVYEPKYEIERNLDRRTQEKLRRGQMKIEASLDLHGMTRLQAHEALESFIVRAQKSGMRTVLIITGKGVENKGILRQEVPRWLYEGVLAPLVLQHYFSKGHHGGDGALYVLLRRVR